MQEGLASRFFWQINIDGYTPEELTQIFKKKMFVPLHHDVTDEWLTETIKENITLFPYYGRSMVSFGHKVIIACSARHATSHDQGLSEGLITRDDILGGLERFKTSTEVEKKDNSYMSMYM